MYLTIAEIVERYRISKTPVYRAVSEGRLKAIRFGGAIRVDEDDLEEYIKASTVRYGGVDRV